MEDPYVTATHPALNSVCCYTLGGKPPCPKKKDFEPISLYEAADNLLRCVEDQRRQNIPDIYNNLKIAIVDAVQMSALVPTAELKQPGRFVCSFNVVSTLLVARGLAHHLVIVSIIGIDCGKIS